jgi:pantetheine-phosphate adenylyltransferase
MASAVYPGSFDPVHNGHVDIATRASRVFDVLHVGVYEAPPKSLIFSTRERIDLLEGSIGHLSNVEVGPFRGLVTDLAHTTGARFIVRGLRAGNDFETEFEMAHMWRNLDSDIDVVCMMSSLQHQFLHSSRIKEVARLGGEISSLVPKEVARALETKLA